MLAFLKKLFGGTESKREQTPSRTVQTEPPLEHTTLPADQTKAPTEQTKPPPAEAASTTSPSKSELKRKAEAQIENLIIQAGPYYPHGDPMRALELFREAVVLAPDAPRRTSSHEAIDLGDVGFAVWAGWVCLDMVEADSDQLESWMNLADAKSPITAKQIRERIEEVSAFEAEQARNDLALSEALNAVHEAVSVGGGTAMARDALIAACREQAAWWFLRDEARQLSKAGHGDLAWALSNGAVSICEETGTGNLPSIREVMGDVCKRDGRYFRACELFILAMVESNGSPSKNAQNQLRICLKKAGLKAESEAVRDELVELALSSGFHKARALLVSKLPNAPH